MEINNQIIIDELSKSFHHIKANPTKAFPINVEIRKASFGENELKIIFEIAHKFGCDVIIFPENKKQFRIDLYATI